MPKQANKSKGLSGGFLSKTTDYIIKREVTVALAKLTGFGGEP